MTQFEQQSQITYGKQFNIAGNQVFQGPTYIYDEPPAILPTPEVHEQRDLTILLQKVKTFWIEGVLENSIHTSIFLTLDKKTDFDAVQHPWESVLELPNQEPKPLPREINIRDIFDDLNRAMLILGEPGSGKTITLLELARELIDIAEADKQFTQPIPVIFNLSSWTQRKPLIEWLVMELSTKYQIPTKIGQKWLMTNRILPLLDGLDEVQAIQRSACVEAINTFGNEIGLAGIVVCCRLREYTDLPNRLRLNGAIRLEPLSASQIDEYLDRVSPNLASLRKTLQRDPPLRELAQSPLMLNIMSLAYQDGAEQITHPLETVEVRREHLFKIYIERMLNWKGKANKPYSDQQTVYWLTWLAQQLVQHNHTVFLIDQLQPSWLRTNSLQWVYFLWSRLLIAVVASSATLLILFGFGGVFKQGFREEFTFGLLAIMLTWSILGLGFGVIDKIQLSRDIATKKKHRQNLMIILSGSLVLGIILGLIFSLYFAISTGPVVGLITFGFAGIFGTGWIYGLRGGRESLTNDIQTTEALTWSWKGALYGGAIAGVSWLVVAMVFWQITSATDSFVLRVIVGYMGSISILFGLLFGGTISSIVETKVQPNEGIRLSLRNSVIFGLGYGSVIGISAGLIVWWGDLNIQFIVPWLDSGLTGLEIIPILGLSVGLMASLWYGGFEIIQHITLRFLLCFERNIPWNYRSFLEYSRQRTFLQRVGGGYIFTHRLLLEHFAHATLAKNAYRPSMQKQRAFFWLATLLPVLTAGLMFTIAINTFPSGLFHFQMGIVYEIICDEPDSAIKEYTKAIQQKPYFLYYWWRGSAFAHLGANDKAIEDITKAINLTEDEGGLYFQRGILYTGLNKPQEAYEDFEKSRELDPERVYTFYGLCLHGVLFNTAESVINECDQAVLLDPSSGVIRDARGLARAVTGDFKGAVEDFEFFIEWSQDYPRYDRRRAERRNWINELKMDHNFIDKTIIEEQRQNLIRDFFGE
ncbi:MAG: NACHT domain-containing protein [Anaerolineae bacterium]|nr:NACHT domain-containing protein [Anaerolineae bacterium]